MSKTNIILLVVIVLLLGLGVGGGGYFFYIKNRAKNQGTATPTLSNILPIAKKASADETYEDPSGFSFMHPSGVGVMDVTPDDDTVYTVLELSYQGQKMTLGVWDTRYKTIEDWLAKDTKAPQGVDLVGAATMGEMSAKQYRTGEQLITVAIGQGVLYLVEGPRDGGFMEETQNILVSTFALMEKATTSQGGGNVIYEEEEIIE